MNIVIKTDNLSKYYGRAQEIKALDNLNVEVYEGETFGLLGPNGAGKTTMVRLLNCIIKPTKGTAKINGYDIIKDSNNVKKVTGLLAETPGIYGKLSAYEFLEFVGALYDVPDSILRDRVEDLLKLFSLFDRKDYLLEGYSSGMRQKLLLAAALIHDPPILFLDEPTSTLDPTASHMVKDLIKDLSERARRTIVICSHILPIVEEVCDRIGIINHGNLIAVGKIEDIMSQTKTKNLEEAFISLTGGIEEKELLSWRELRRAAP